jgi:predicted RNA-binding protein (TIGR00451 family)
MSFRKELGAKQRKNLISSIFAPGFPTNKLKNHVQFLMNDEKRQMNFLLNRDQNITFFSFENMYLPTLKFIRKHPELEFPTVQVDEGAVKFVINGADIFAQGIVKIADDFAESSIVAILNPQDSVLCIGKSLFSSEEILEKKGKSILNLHYLGDRIWDEMI